MERDPLNRLHQLQAERVVAAAQARMLRDWGLSLRQTAILLDVNMGRLARLLYDADGEKGRIRGRRRRLVHGAVPGAGAEAVVAPKNAGRTAGCTPAALRSAPPAGPGSCKNTAAGTTSLQGAA